MRQQWQREWANGWMGFCRSDLRIEGMEERRTATSNQQQATCDQQQATSDQQQATVRGYRRLVVWQKADELAYQIYQATQSFPSEERFSLTLQMRRASVSVAANIVEGYTHSTPKERCRFYEIARASLTELEYYIDFAFLRLRYIDDTQYEVLRSLRQDVGRLLHGFLKSER